MSIEVFGIRHHGPGSARSLVEALERFRPDLLLLEGPPDAEALIPLAPHPEMQPPVAMLVYNPKNLEQASFFPFAEFSPEWQAILFGLKRHIPLRFMDMPMGVAFAMREQAAPPTLNFQEKNDDSLSADPFRKMALLAGYSDPERWWDALVERSAVPPAADMSAPDASIFSVILALMQAMREETIAERDNLLREAFMRQHIRAARKEGFSKIAVVCGAWHGPALADWEKTKAANDAALLKGLPKIKTEATWIPWSFDRLAAQSGYSAGVVAPAWYRTLWECGMGHSEAPARSPQVQFLTQAARLLRENDLAASSAHVIEAVRLAEHLAVLRNTPSPGIEELREAAVTVLCNGAEKQLELIDQQLVVGDVLGAVPSTLAVPPLKADFEQQAKSCRLKKNTQEEVLELDLRKEAHLQKSRLLHRLNLLGVAWGKMREVGGGKQGRFHEHWQLKWLPDYEIRLIEAGTWGNTVEDAASRRAWRKVRDSDELPELTQLLDTTLKADLPAIVPDLLHKLRTVSALAKDALLLADVVLPLAEVLRYGAARQLNLDAVAQLLGQIVPRVCIQLPAASTGVDETAAAVILKKILAVNRALGILQMLDYETSWGKTLEHITQLNNAAPLLAGLCSRMLFDKGIRSSAQTGDSMRFRLSRAEVPALAAQWLEGFLHGSGLLLLHHAELWQTLDGWVRTLSPDDFKELLPLLRRTFAQFSEPERQKMLDLAKNDTPLAVNAGQEEGWDDERAAGVLALVQAIFKDATTVQSG
ncbi:MAG: hypothetical protein KIS77_13555 [Saprospiraceae bacterium]|nr:hypothetical protein [Saprospiraceae bacterium]